MTDVILTTIPVTELQTMISDSVIQALSKKDLEPTTEVEDNQLIKITDVASLLKVSLPTVYKYKKAGLISFYRIGRRVFFKRNEIINSLQKVVKKGN